MAKKAYVGVESVARKTTKSYFGVDNLARKVKKAYIGIGNVARPFWSGGDSLAYYGIISGTSNLLTSWWTSQQKCVSGNNFAFLTGDSGSYTYTNVRCVNKSLSVVTPTALSEGRGQGVGGIFNGTHTMFAGESVTSVNTTSIVDAYDENLTKSNPTAISYKADGITPAMVNGITLFCGGANIINYTTGEYTGYRTVTTYDSALTKGSAANLANYGYAHTGTNFNGRAIIAGGANCPDTLNRKNRYTNVEAYDASLTKTALPVLPLAVSTPSIVTTELHMFIVGGTFYDGNNGGYDANSPTYSIYNKSFTRVSTGGMNVYNIYASGNFGAVGIGQFACFAGSGYNTAADSKTIITFNASLTISTSLIALPEARSAMSGAKIGDYALFTGGRMGSSKKSTTYAYALV